MTERNILVFEPLEGGHRAFFLQTLRAYLERHPSAGIRWVFVDAAAAERLMPGFAQWFGAAGRWRRPWILHRLFRACCRAYAPDHALILELTALELPFVLRGASVPVSAILFVQYPELRRGVKFFWKQVKTAGLLRRVRVRNLFLLNGERSCRYLRERFPGPVHFLPVPDPVPSVAAEPGFSLHGHYGLEPGRPVFLFFGAFSRRKGADRLLRALHGIRPETAERAVFLFCGVPEPDYRKRFEAECAALRRRRPEVRLITDLRFIPDGEAAALFEQARVVLMPYARPEYSSGLLGLAARAGVAVIGPEEGLIGRLIREYGLGGTVAGGTSEWVRALDRAVVEWPRVDASGCRRFVKERDPARFAEIMRDAVCDES